MFGKKKKILCIALAILLACIFQRNFWKEIQSVKLLKEHSEVKQEIGERSKEREELQGKCQLKEQEYKEEQLSYEELNKEKENKENKWNTYTSDVDVKLQEYADLLRDNLMSECDYTLPLFNYNFTGINKASEEMNLLETAGSLLSGNSFVGSLLADAVIGDMQATRISELQAIVDFNSAMEHYIETHAQGLNILQKYHAQKSFLLNMATPSEDVQENYNKLMSLQTLLDDKIVDGKLRFSEAELFENEEDLKELIKVEACSNFMINAYWFLFDEYNDWNYFEIGLYNVVTFSKGSAEYWKYFHDALRENDYWLHKQYISLVDTVGFSKSTIDGLQKDYRKFFVKGSGDRYLYAFYRGEEVGNRHYFVIQETDYKGNVLAVYYYDYYGETMAVLDKSHQKEYFYWWRENLQDDEKSLEVLEYSDWLKSVFDEGRDATNQEYINQRACMEN